MNSSSWTSVSLPVQWAQWHPMTSLIGMQSTGKVPMKFAVHIRMDHGPWTALQTCVDDSPGQFPIDNIFFICPHMDLENLSFWNKDWCFQPQEIIYVIMVKEMNRAQDGFQPLCPVFCQDTFWQACFLCVCVWHLYSRIEENCISKCIWREML